MRRNVRFALLALALVLCALVGIGSPVTAKIPPISTCGPNPPSCFTNQDCNAFCQPCGTVGFCFTVERDPTQPGACACSAY